LLHTTGVHGVEGFAGSGLQIHLLEDGPPLAKSTAAIFVHGINPYGMAWLRRVNENNVDLNRNFLGPEESYEGAAESYRKLNGFLNPEGPPRSVDPFLIVALFSILRYGGYVTLKQAIAGGQYEYPSGLFFGGRRLEQGSTLILEWCQRTLSNARQITVIDIHTGLGKYGNEIVMSRNAINSDQHHRLEKLLGDRLAPHHPTGPAYRVRGGFLRGLELHVQGPEWTLILQEFGTRNPLAKLRALRDENRWHRYGQPTQLEHPVKQRLLNTYFPADTHWRNRVLTRGTELFEQFA